MVTAVSEDLARRYKRLTRCPIDVIPTGVDLERFSPSARHHEGTPAALLEAMAVGLPCFATRVGGVPALLGSAGVLIQRRNPRAIADGAESLLGNPGLREQLGVLATQRARFHAVGRQARACADIYSLLSESGSECRAEAVRKGVVRRLGRGSGAHPVKTADSHASTLTSDWLGKSGGFQ